VATVVPERAPIAMAAPSRARAASLCWFCDRYMDQTRQGPANVSVASQDVGRYRVRAGSTAQTELPFTGLSPRGVAVDAAGGPCKY